MFWRWRNDTEQRSVFSEHVYAVFCLSWKGLAFDCFGFEAKNNWPELKIGFMHIWMTCVNGTCLSFVFILHAWEMKWMREIKLLANSSHLKKKKSQSEYTQCVLYVSVFHYFYFCPSLLHFLWTVYSDSVIARFQSFRFVSFSIFFFHFRSYF